MNGRLMALVEWLFWVLLIGIGWTFLAWLIGRRLRTNARD